MLASISGPSSTSRSAGKGVSRRLFDPRDSNDKSELSIRVDSFADRVNVPRSVLGDCNGVTSHSLIIRNIYISLYTPRVKLLKTRHKDAGSDGETERGLCLLYAEMVPALYSNLRAGAQDYPDL